MSSIIDPGKGILFMKIGVHAQEPLEKIIARKLKEIEQEGFALWGYGGNTCHPTSMVQPFASSFAERGESITLCMKEMQSGHFAEPVRASELSVDGSAWQKIPPGINVLGSRYALAISNLRKAEFDLPLATTTVAVGRSQGAIGSQYVLGRVDKACLLVGERGNIPPAPDTAVERIGLIADLCAPYAVFLRN